MRAGSGTRGKQRRIIDVDAVSADLCPAHLEHIGEWYGDLRPIVTGVGHRSLASYRAVSLPCKQKFVMAGAYRGKKPRYRHANLFSADDHRSIAEAKLRIWREQAQEPRRVESVDDCEYTPPPRAIGSKFNIWHDVHAPSILDATNKRLITDG